MPSTLETSLRLRQSLREGRHAFDALVMCPSTGNILTVDRAAVRLWSLQRQIKACHISKDKSDWCKAVGAYFLSDLNVFLLVYSFTRRIPKADDNDEECDLPMFGGMIEVWSSSLHKLQEIKLNYLQLKVCIMNAKNQLVLVDVSENCYVLDIFHKHVQPPPPPTFTTAKSKSTELSTTSVQHELLLYVREVQLIHYEDPEMIIDSKFVASNMFVLLYANEIVLYAGSSINDDDNILKMNDLNPSCVVKVDGTSVYSIVHRFSIFSPAGSFPTSVIFLEQFRYAVAYSCGMVQILICNATSDSDLGKSDSKIIAQILAHEVTRAPCSISLLNVDWSSRAPGGHDMEFISVGGTNTCIKIWGLRNVSAVKTDAAADTVAVYSLSGVESLADIPVEGAAFTLDELGRFAITPEPTSKVVSKPRRLRMSKLNIVSYELKASYAAVSVRRELLCGLGGMLAFLEVHQPHLKLTAYPPPAVITDACKGPKSTFFTNSQVNLNSNAGIGCFTCIILHQDLVDVISSSTGELVQQFGTQYLFDQLKDSTIDTIGKNHAFNEATREREGRPTMVHWCSLNNVIFVGYTTGGVGILAPNTGRSLKINTIGCHSVSIRCCYTFYQQLKRSFNSCLIIGDESGVLSLWQLNKSEYRLIKRYEAHSGAILYAESISGCNEYQVNTTGIDKILITACSKGIVKAWVQHHVTGELLLTSFFHTPNAMQSFLPILLVNTVAASSIEKLSNQREKGSVAENSLASLDGSISTANAQNAFLVNVLCVCGLSNGEVQGWILSSSSHADTSKSVLPGFSVQSPVWTLVCHEASISTIVRMRNSEGDVLQDSAFHIMCSSAVGCSILLQIGCDGEFLRKPTFFTMPIPAIKVLPSSFVVGDAPTLDEFVFVGENQIVEVSPAMPLEVSMRWNKLHLNTTGMVPALAMNQDVLSGRDLDASAILDQALIDNNAENDTNIEQSLGILTTEEAHMTSVEDGDDENGIGASESIVQTYNESLDASIDVEHKVYPDSESKFQNSQEIDSKWYSESMESIDRAVTSDLYFAKKDPNLIKLFVQANKLGNDRSYVSYDTATSIVEAWLANAKAGEVVIWEIMDLLGISPSDAIQFNQIAKVAALAATIAKKRRQSNVNKLGVNEKSASLLLDTYYKLRTKKKIVSYNAMGEPVVETIGMTKRIVNGRANGNCVKFHKSMLAQPSKVMDSLTQFSITTPSSTLLQTIPARFIPHFKSKWLVPVELPSTWDSNNQHWFDLRRAVRVARTILDMRSSKQQEYVINPEGKTLDSLVKVTCLYFERSFGHGRLNVSNHKIIHFLEACLQYVHCSVMNFIQIFLCPVVALDEPSDLCLWIYIELRQYLFAKGVVEDGDVIPPSEFGESSYNVTKGDHAQLRWQLVSRNEAMIAIDEMFRNRGKFGVQVLHRLFHALEVVPDVEIRDGNLSMIDMEVFLYDITMEFRKIELLMKEIELQLFDSRSIPMYIVATARDIYTDIPEKIQVNAAYRKSNIMLSLDRIRALMAQFVYHDPRRLGIIDQITFRSIVVVAGQTILSFDCGRDAHKLVDQCLVRFRSNSPDSAISYADFLATLLAWVHLEQGGTHGLDGTAAINAFKTTSIGVGDKDATALMLLIGLMPCPQHNNCLWTARSATSEPDRKSIPKNGNWLSKPPLVETDFQNLRGDNEEIGSLMVLAKAAATGGSAEAKELPSLEVKQGKAQLEKTHFSYIPAENRQMQTSSSEVLNFSKIGGSKREKTKLTLKDMSVVAAEIHNNVDPEPKSANIDVLVNMGSYSRSMSKLVDARVGFDGIQKIGEISAASHDDSTIQSGPLQLRGNSESEKYSTKPSKQAFFDEETLRAQASSFIREKLASEEVEKRRAVMVSDEQNLLLQMEIEQERYAKSRAMKQGKAHRQMAEARAKERISMRFKAKQDAARQRRREAGVKLYEDAVLQMNLDVNAAFAEVKAKQDAERERVRLIKLEKDHAEELLRERERETQEGIIMRAQEKASTAYELAVKEKLAKEKAEREAKEAKEAKEAAERREKERLAEEARVAAQLKKEAEEAAELEETNRRMNYKLMKAEDVNVLKILTPEELAKIEAEEKAALEEIARKEAEAVASRPVSKRAKSRTRSRPGTKGKSRPSSRSHADAGEDESVGEEEGSFDEDDLSAAPAVEHTPLEQRFLLFLDKMKFADKRNADHPRRQPNKASYFMPMLFSSDIQFSNFDSAMDDEGHRLSSWNLEDLGKARHKPPTAVDLGVTEKPNDFADIAHKVKEHKMKLIRDRLENLYRTSSTEDSSAEWTEVMKKDFVDWVTFFDEQEGILMQRPPTPPPPVDEEAVFLNNISLMARKLISQPEDDDSLDVPKSLLVPSDRAIDAVIPLPLGKVIRGIVLNGAYKYYQVEVVDPRAVHTFELKSLRGYADMYINSGSELPTKVNYEHYGHSGAHNNRIVRLFFEPGKLGTLIVGIHSNIGASYELWGFASGQVSVMQAPMREVSNSLRRWEIIQNHSIEDMESRLPELMNEASNIVQFENAMAKPSILADYQAAAAIAKVGDKVEEDDNSDDEVGIMDEFISKAGRRLIRRDMLSAKVLTAIPKPDQRMTVDEDDCEVDYINPNSHVELFKKPALTKRGDFLDIVGPLEKLDADENFNFTMLSLLKRKEWSKKPSGRGGIKGSTRSTNPMSLSLPMLNTTSSIHESVTSSWGIPNSVAQKPFKLPKSIVAPVQKLNYTLHRTENTKKLLK